MVTLGCAIFEEGCNNDPIDRATHIVNWKQCGSRCDRYDKECNYWRYHIPTKECFLYLRCDPKKTDIRDIRGSSACFSGIKS